MKISSKKKQREMRSRKGLPSSLKLLVIAFVMGSLFGLTGSLAWYARHADRRRELEDLEASVSAKLKQAARVFEQQRPEPAPKTTEMATLKTTLSRDVAPLQLPVSRSKPSLAARESIQLRKASPKDSIGIHLVSHTHWDREWYRSLEEFTRLFVNIVDDAIPRVMNSSSGIRSFHLDAQTRLLLDYLQARPNELERVRSLLNSDSLTSGPWYTQPDLFLPSGESLVRNLLFGTEELASLGMPFSPIGYAPDQFGHTSQMAQIYLQFDLIAAAAMRGLPLTLNRNSWWEAPDGSRILMLKFSNYCGIEFSKPKGMRKPKSLERKIRKKLADNLDRDKGEKITSLYWMNGCDHRGVDVNAGTAIVKAQESHTHWSPMAFGARNVSVREVASSTLADVANLVLEEIKEEKIALPIIRGELRNNVDELVHVTSSGMSLKLRNWRSQTLLEDWAEPLDVTASVSEQIEIHRAWKLVLENHFHDTICTTSVPQVFFEAKNRAERAIQIAEGIASQHIAHQLRQITPYHKELVFVFNPTNVARIRQLVVMYMMVPVSVLIRPEDILVVTDVVSGSTVNATVVSSWQNLWSYRHMAGEFREGINFNLLRIAMRPLEMGPNQIRMLHVSHNPQYSDPALQIRHLERRKKLDQSNKLRVQVRNRAQLKAFQRGLDPAKKYELTTTQIPKQSEQSNPSYSVAATLQNDFMKVELTEVGSLVVNGMSLNQILIQPDHGTQYYAQFGSALGPLVMEDLDVIENQDFMSASFHLRGRDLMPKKFDEFELKSANYDQIETVWAFDLSVSYVLPRSSRQIWVRITLENLKGGARNFAVRAAHQTKCKIMETVADNAFDWIKRSRFGSPDCKPFHKWFLARGDTCALGIAGKGLYDYRIDMDSTVEMTLMRAVDRVGDWAPFANEAAQDFGEHSFEYAIIPLDLEEPKDSSEASGSRLVEMMASEGRQFAQEACAVQHVNRGLLPQLPLTCVSSTNLVKLGAKYPPYSEGYGRNFESEHSDESLFGASPKGMKFNAPSPTILVGGVTVQPAVLELSSVKRSHRNPEKLIVVRFFNPTDDEIEGSVTVSIPVAAIYLSQLNERKMRRLWKAGDAVPFVIRVKAKKIVTILLERL